METGLQLADESGNWMEMALADESAYEMGWPMVDVSGQLMGQVSAGE